NDLRSLRWTLLGTGTGILAIGLLGGWILAGRLVRPIREISRLASTISASHLDERIDPRRLDVELVGLAEVLNAMLGRLGESFERQARFTADASHELRTPLTVLLANLDLALARPRTADEYRTTLKVGQQAAVRMRALVEGLLVLARADADRLELQRSPID